MPCTETAGLRGCAGRAINRTLAVGLLAGSTVTLSAPRTG
jgi:hypothetical protein